MGHMVPRLLPPVAGITKARPGQRMTGTALAWIPCAVNPKSKRSYLLPFFFFLQVQKGSKPDVCLSTKLFAFYNSAASHTHTHSSPAQQQEKQ